MYYNYLLHYFFLSVRATKSETEGTIQYASKDSLYTSGMFQFTVSCCHLLNVKYLRRVEFTSERGRERSVY